MREKIEELMGALAHIRLRPGMYFSSEVPALQNFMYGFSIACAILGVDTGKEEAQLWSEHGWKLSNHHPVTILKEQGLSDDEISAEIFSVLILALQRKYGVSSEPVLEVHRVIREKTIKTQTALDNPTENSIYKTNEAIAKSARELVEHTLRAMEKLEKEMDRS
jgi:hypothetical protein